METGQEKLERVLALILGVLLTFLFVKAAFHFIVEPSLMRVSEHHKRVEIIEERDK